MSKFCSKRKKDESSEIVQTLICWPDTQHFYKMQIASFKQLVSSTDIEDVDTHETSEVKGGEALKM